jgi:4-hydroxybenzoyl-CoA thioesterase/acyl-CoA thioester hydrolase
MAFIHKRRVEFRDTDAAGIVHFSVFFPMMEEAEHAALRHVGLSVMSPENVDGHLTWPRISATCDYVSAARFEDVLDICVTVVKIGTTSVTYAFQFLRGEQTIANGKITAVCCMWQPGKPLAKQPIPPEIRSAIEGL